MTREQLIEVIAQEARRATSASGKVTPEWDAIHVSLRNWWLGVGEKTLDALTAAGMVMVPREPTEAMVIVGQIASIESPSIKDIPARVYLAMTEAANAE